MTAVRLCKSLAASLRSKEWRVWIICGLAVFLQRLDRCGRCSSSLPWFAAARPMVDFGQPSICGTHHIISFFLFFFFLFPRKRNGPWQDYFDTNVLNTDFGPLEPFIR
ncbi:hypothetical protein N658DRAFT_289586 [Parathielavia hyrcaniae]|uniref:Uncharacterized protein n=1 Tax=Parathielavia hyrcaniae TaxID=113614 RepID=A0AAN6PVM4_9PEZI|nr:hypothetical protein N658DRAFT_289586 [Parathielavia hyrcaniae]